MQFNVLKLKAKISTDKTMVRNGDGKVFKSESVYLRVALSSQRAPICAHASKQKRRLVGILCFVRDSHLIVKMYARARPLVAVANGDSGAMISHSTHNW